MSKKQKAWAIFAGAVVVQVIASRFAKEQARTLGLSAKAVAAATVLAAAVLSS
ncbi:hypothetical protein ACFVZH_22340 [Streptomyces sp. NPDC059534]|uniref:hypothetical protein n=1 Tax=Streptomyces sp. NPDC059534 TaxID=3346859 RepID=UPI0036C656DA